MYKKFNKVIFWDFDGTLVYNNRIWSNSLYDALVNFNYNIDMEEIRCYLHKGYTWSFPEISYVDYIGQKWWEKLFMHLGSLYKNNMVLKEDTAKINSYFKNQILDFRNYTLYENAIEVLCKCKEMGYKNYILSNNFPELPQIAKDLGLAEYFMDYVVSANIGYEKPRIELFQYALNIADYPDICYMIGDNPIGDIQGGKSAGMKTIFVHNDSISDADYKCRNLSEIPLIIYSACPQS